MSEHTNQALEALTLAVRQASQHLARIATAMEETNKRNPTPKLTDPDKPNPLGTDQW